MDTLADRLALWALRSAARAMLFAGVSVLVAAPMFGMFFEASSVRAITGVLFRLSGVFVAAGALAAFLSRRSARELPNERAIESDGARPPVGGWLIALAFVLVTLPVWLVIQLQPFLAEWSRVVEALAAWDIWRGANANMSGIILVPLAGALTPPLFELAALSTFIVAPVMLLPLLFARSRRFPRVFIVFTVLLAGFVIASLLGADAASLAGDAARQFIEDSGTPAPEDAQVRDVLNRYTAIVGSTAPVLAWASAAYFVWLPGMIYSQRVRTTFASRADTRDSAPTKALDIEAITRPPRFPG